MCVYIPWIKVKKGTEIVRECGALSKKFPVKMAGVNMHPHIYEFKMQASAL